MSKLPEFPVRPHDFHRIESRFVEFKQAMDYLFKFIIVQISSFTLPHAFLPPRDSS